MKANIKELLAENEKNKELFNFIKDHNISEDDLNNNVGLLEQYLISFNLCKIRENLSKCQQEVPGYRLKLAWNQNKIGFVLTDCLHRINSLDQKSVLDNFLIRHYADELLSLSWTKDFISRGIEREKIINYLKEVTKLTSYQGLYLHGDSNVGKTFIFILLANKFIQKKHTVCFIVWPEFVSEVKKSFKGDSDSLNHKIELIKKCDYLFIDDLGNENVTSWERDELLFPIINSRVLPLKTTFINSNFSFTELAQCYTLQNNKIESTRVKRLIMRIKKLTFPVQLTKTIENL